MKKTIFLREPLQAHKALTAVLWPLIKSHLLCGGGALVVTVKPETRSLDQNAKFHAIVADIAKSGIQWAGKPRSEADWKTLLVSGHAVATKESGEIVPGIECEFVSLRESTAAMSRARGSSLIEYSQAFAVMRGVTLSGRAE